MRWVTCHKCCDYAYVDETELKPETACCDYTFSAGEQSCLKALEHGDQRALLYFVSFCFLQRRDVPAWAQEKFRAAVAKGFAFEIMSWDDVFGRPLKKGKQLEAAYRKRNAMQKVWELVNARRRAGEALDNKLFGAVGRDTGVGGATVVSEIYKEISDQFKARAKAERGQTWGRRARCGVAR